MGSTDASAWPVGNSLWVLLSHPQVAVMPWGQSRFQFVSSVAAGTETGRYRRGSLQPEGALERAVPQGEHGECLSRQNLRRFRPQDCQ
ncbi:MAG: hypothetical protein AMXMBFR13_03060 [Phycisphaerae bacterium]